MTTPTTSSTEPTPASNTEPTPAGLLAQAVRDDPARALLTFHDDATGERAELSVATFANWVAKTANFARDGLGLDTGDRVAIALPCHWQALVWWQACWAAGLVVVPVPDDPAVTGPVEALVRAAPWPADAPGTDPGPPAGDVVALGLGPMALPVAGTMPPAGAIDHDREIHSHGDRFPPPPGLGGDTPALEGPDGVRSAAELVALAQAAVARWSLSAGDRVLGVTTLRDATDAVAMLLAPLLSGAGVVLGRHAGLADEPTLTRRLHEEGVTAVAPHPCLPAGLSQSGARHLD